MVSAMMGIPVPPIGEGRPGRLVAKDRVGGGIVWLRRRRVLIVAARLDAIGRGVMSRLFRTVISGCSQAKMIRCQLARGARPKTAHNLIVQKGSGADDG